MRAIGWFFFGNGKGKRFSSTDAVSRTAKKGMGPAGTRFGASAVGFNGDPSWSGLVGGLSMKMHVRGIKRYKSKWREYFYHRATGRRILVPVGTAAFLSEVAKLDEDALSQKIGRDPSGTWGWLQSMYLGSHEFRSLADGTKAGYRHILKILEPMRKVRFEEIDAPRLMQVRDLIAKKHGRRTANYVLQVTSLIFQWGLPRGHCVSNPARGLPKIKRSRSERPRNRAWSDQEISTFLDRGPSHLALPVALGVFTGLREGDVLHLTWQSIEGGVIKWRQAKTGEMISIPIHRDLEPFLSKAPRCAVQVCTSSHGRPWTSSGFRASFRMALARLADRLGDHLTFHGLRHTFATRLADAGADSRTIMAVTGHASEAMVSNYTKMADRSRRAKVAVKLLEGNDA